MKTLLLVVGLVVGLVGQAHAAETEQRLTAVGGFQTADAVVIGSATLVTAVGYDCGGTACVFSLYNGTTTGEMTNANGKYEDGGAANTGEIVVLSEPIYFPDGVVLNVDANVNAVTVYTAQPK